MNDAQPSALEAIRDAMDSAVPGSTAGVRGLDEIRYELELMNSNITSLVHATLLVAKTSMVNRAQITQDQVQALVNHIDELGESLYVQEEESPA